ncbi:aminotransferase class IV family protein [uncultured Amaricoccus sp.]|uniref:aminotransferase class IV family protein n=1 Tax=uncultured Amaricoccus sp. TaxID=339341 RepID=UPI00260F4837|nr:aminotransferase class IV family protein [uncultured Amaricoccus sp.]
MESALHRPLPADFRLIETMAWRRNPGFLDLDLHLARLERTARVFGIRFAPEEVQAALADVARGEAPARVRLTLAPDGRAAATAEPFVAGPDIWIARIAEERLDPADPWLRVKTTMRARYDTARAGLPRGVHEMLFLNRRGEICEGTIFNVFLKVGDIYLTPRLACGLLPGVLREKLLREGRAREAVLTRADLGRGRLFLGNSLRGLCAARLV